MKELLNTIKQRYPQITNVIRIKNDKRPLPLTRLFTKDPQLVSNLITNGVHIGCCRFRVEESRNSGRPFPCRTCLLYHINKPCSKKISCYKCGKEHLSYTCNQIPNKNYCGTCKERWHRKAAASSCPLRPMRGQINHHSR